MKQVYDSRKYIPGGGPPRLQPDLSPDEFRKWYKVTRKSGTFYKPSSSGGGGGGPPADREETEEERKAREAREAELAAIEAQREAERLARLAEQHAKAIERLLNSGDRLSEQFQNQITKLQQRIEADKLAETLGIPDPSRTRAHFHISTFNPDKLLNQLSVVSITSVWIRFFSSAMFSLFVAVASASSVVDPVTPSRDSSKLPKAISPSANAVASFGPADVPNQSMRFA